MLAGNIDSFKSSIARHGGFAHQNYFAIFMQLPLLNLNLDNIARNVLGGNTNPLQLINDPRDIAFLCESCTIPGRSIATTEYANTSGKAVKKPYAYINEEVTFTFLLTGDYFIKHFLDEWMNQIFDYNTQRLSYKKDYVRDVEIMQLSKNGVNAPIYTVKLMGAYPIAVNAIELTNTGENTIQRVTVTLAYDDFMTSDIVDTALDIGTDIMRSVTGIPGQLKDVAATIGTIPDKLGRAVTSIRSFF
jgi:hypothetical protein